MLCSYNFRGIGFYCRFCRCIEGRSCVAQIQQNSAVISREFHPKGTLYEFMKGEKLLLDAVGVNGFYGQTNSCQLTEEQGAVHCLRQQIIVG